MAVKYHCCYKIALIILYCTRFIVLILINIALEKNMYTHNNRIY